MQLFRTPAAILVFMLVARVAEGHSLGIVRLRETRGPFVVTVFTSPELVSGRVANVSVLVQERESNEAILDAAVNFVFTPPSGSTGEHAEAICGVAAIGARDAQTPIPARREESPNKLFYTVPMNFPLPGAWKLEASIRRGTDALTVTCEIPVGAPPRALAGLIPYLALPPLLTALYALNQMLRAARCP